MKNTIMLKKNYEFKNVLRRGKYYAGRKIEAFIYSKNSENKKEEKNKLGLAIGVKRGKATKRNRIKRLLRESYKQLEPNLSTGNSIVFLSKKSEKIENTTFEDVFNDMKEIFEKAEILK